MRAVVCQAWGKTDTLTFTHVAEPTLGDGQVRIAIHAAGLNFADTMILAGTYQVRPVPPFVPGFEAAGEVLEVASGVTRCRPGDRVMAVLDYGAFAEQAVVRAEDVFVLPAGMDFVTAASFPIAYGTSHVGLWERAGLQAGETLLIHGAAGGVGLTAVEIGKAMGATVIATAGGAHKLAVAARYGADHLIDYNSEDIRQRVKDLTDGRGADVIYDPVGGEAFEASLRCTAWNGRILIVGFAGGRVPQIPANVLLIKNLAALGFYWGSYRMHKPAVITDSFTTLFDWFVQGRLKPHVSHVLPLERTAEAIDMLVHRKATGKVVVVTPTSIGTDSYQRP